MTESLRRRTTASFCLLSPGRNSPPGCAVPVRGPAGGSGQGQERFKNRDLVDIEKGVASRSAREKTHFFSNRGFGLAGNFARDWAIGSELSDAQWETIQDLAPEPPPNPRGGRPPVPPRPRLERTLGAAVDRGRYALRAEQVVRGCRS